MTLRHYSTKDVLSLRVLVSFYGRDIKQSTINYSFRTAAVLKSTAGDCVK